jgi:hypothetical protein
MPGSGNYVNQLCCQNNGLVLFSWQYSPSNPTGRQVRPGRI